MKCARYGVLTSSACASERRVSARMTTQNEDTDQQFHSIHVHSEKAAQSTNSKNEGDVRPRRLHSMRTLALCNEAASRLSRLGFPCSDEMSGSPETPLER